MREKKRGERGIAASYMTRTQAIKRLHITLKDFRRLCILKGIFPRDPKKKKYGRGKTYYHRKDINFLAHEPLLQKFRQIKTYLKKYVKAIHKKELSRARRLKKNKPKLILDHLVKERYPTFGDALRDLDDPLTMVNLFAHLPTKTTKHHSGDVAQLCAKYSREFQLYVARTFSLRKVFVSIKGFYYQAEVNKQVVTWLVPHSFSHTLPRDVDYRVMFTFLEFYLCMMKFILYKLFRDAQLPYPPIVDRANLANGHFFDKNHTTNSRAAEKAPQKSKPNAQQKQLQKQVDEIVNSLKEEQEAKTDDVTVKVEENDTAEFAKLDSSIVTEQEDDEQVKLKKLFAGVNFVLGRELPLESIEFVIACAGGVTYRQDSLNEQQMRNSELAYHIIDRPAIPDRVAGRIYVQPQWVYDSFNARTLLPTDPYAPGVTPPPHLSPFVDDEAEGYIPKQRLVLQQWGAQGSGDSVKSEDDEKKATADDEDADEDEEQFQKDLQLERRGVLFSQKKQLKDEDDDEEEDNEEEGHAEGDDDEEEEEEDGADESDSDLDLPEDNDNENGDDNDDQQAETADGDDGDDGDEKEEQSEDNDEFAQAPEDVEVVEQPAHASQAQLEKKKEIVCRRRKTTC